MEYNPGMLLWLWLLIAPVLAAIMIAGRAPSMTDSRERNDEMRS